MTANNNEKYLIQFKQALSRYALVTDESFAKWSTLMKLKTIEKGEYPLQVGQVARKMYFVCEGILSAIYLNPEGNSHTKNFFLESHFAASTASLLQAAPSAFSIQALENSIVLEFDYQQYKHLVRTDNNLKDFYIAYLEDQWVLKNEKRHIAFATQTSAERYHTFLEQYPDLDKRVPQHYIASYLGVTPTQLSRLRRDL